MVQKTKTLKDKVKKSPSKTTPREKIIRKSEKIENTTDDKKKETIKKRVSEHLKRNKKRYIGGLSGIAIGGIVYSKIPKNKEYYIKKVSDYAKRKSAEIAKKKINSVSNSMTETIKEVGKRLSSVPSNVNASIKSNYELLKNYMTKKTKRVDEDIFYDAKEF